MSLENLSYAGLSRLFAPVKEDTRPEYKKPQVVKNLLKATELIALGYEDVAIDGKQLGDGGAIQLAHYIRNKPRALKKLRVDNHNIGDKGAIELFETLITNRTIQSLEMRQNKLGGKAMKKCFEMLKVNTTLSFLDLDNNRGIGEVGATLIAASLRQNKTLTAIYLTHCNLPEKGLIEISKSLADNDTLTVITLARNSNSTKVAEAFAEALKYNTTLRTLDLSGGSKKIGDKGMVALAKMLVINRSLRSLSVRKSSIRETGCVAFGKMIAKNKTLQTVDLSDNHLGGKGLYSIVQGMRLNKTMRNIYIDHFSTDLGRELTNLLDFNKAQRTFVEKLTFEDVLKDGKAKGPIMRSKLMFIGQGKSGKTATVRALLGEPFVFEWKSTIAAALSEAKISSRNGWAKVPSEDKYEFTRDFAAAIALKDIEEKDEKELAEFSDEGNEYIVGKNQAGEEEITATGTKLEDEMPQSAHPNEEIDGVPVPPLQDYQSKNDLFDTDLIKNFKLERDAIKFSLWDFGGQRIFYSLHHLFLSKYGIYALIFSMEQMHKDPSACKDYLRFWLNSLSLHAPETPLLLIGTFWDKIMIGDDFKEITHNVVRVLNKYPFNVVENTSDKLLFFPISNKTGLGIPKLREILDQTARKQPFVTKEIPLTWIYTIEYLLTETGEPWITVLDLKGIAARYKIKEEEEVLEMIKLFHDMGLLLHLTNTSILSEVVILKPQWLLTSLGRIIRDSELHKHNKKYIDQANLQSDVEHLFKDGLVSDKFLNMVWREKQVDYLLDVMKQTLILCDWDFKNSSVQQEVGSDGKLKKYYFVPSLVTGSADLEYYDDQYEEDNVKIQKQEADKLEFLQDKLEMIDHICFFEFDFLPDGIFDRLVCLCVAHSAGLGIEHPPIINPKHCEIFLEDSVTVKLYERKVLDTLYLELGDNTISVQKAQSSLMIVSAMLQKLKKDIIGEGLNWKIFFPKSPKEIISYEEAVKSNLSPWFVNLSKEQYEAKTDISNHINVDKFLDQLKNF